jgi:anti-sigma regulatory factor (Ser/Thr protein kinase)
MKSERTFPNATQSIVRARRFAIETLTGLDPEVVDSLTVMVSELVTNSVRHAASEFTVSIDRNETRIRVAVSDLGERRPSMRNPGPTEPSGRGLQIVDALSDDWGVTETAGRSGKTVWFVLALRLQGDGAEDRASEPRAVPPRPEVTTGDAPRTAGHKPPRGASKRRQESRTRRGAMSRV